MSKIVSIIQPSFLPWQGYFEQMARSDLFVYLDDVQYTKQDWRNRNRVKSPKGAAFLTVPVVKPGDGATIKEIRISYQEQWQKKMKNCLRAWYSAAPAYAELEALLAKIVEGSHALLADFIYETNNMITDYLGIHVPVMKASDLVIQSDDKNGRLVEICRKTEATLLYDGWSAQDFIDRRLFSEHGISVVFQEYGCTPYPQLWEGGFISHLSVLDLMMNCGKGSLDIILSNVVAPGLRKGNGG